MTRGRSLLLVGGGGALGAALLAEALAEPVFRRVQTVVDAAMASTLRGFETLPLAALQAGAALGADTAVIVFEREQRANGRNDAFVQPQPGDLLPLARRLHEGGVRHLAVALPHAPALLPHALRHGFATLDEAAVAALGFEHVLVVRAAQYASAAVRGNAMHRLAAWWLSQLKLMVPQHEQPLRSVVLARHVMALLRDAPAAPPGLRVVATETLSR